MNARKTPPRQKDEPFLEYISFRATRWVGSTGSLLFHTCMFLVSFLLYFLGVPFNTVLLTLTTIVSLEAIYLSIFIQMSVNRQTKQLREVSKDVDEIHENVEDIQEDMGEIQKDIDEIQEDVGEIQEDVEDIQEDDADAADKNAVDPAMLHRIEHSLRELGKEIAEMKRRGHGGRSLLGE
jgi:uncharacterized membrane protein